MMKGDREKREGTQPRYRPHARAPAPVLAPPTCRARRLAGSTHVLISHSRPPDAPAAHRHARSPMRGEAAGAPLPP